MNLPHISFEMDQASLDAFNRALQEMPGSVDISMLESLKKTQRHLRREVVKGLKKNTTLDPKKISQSVKAERVRRDGGSILGILRIASGPLPLINYDVNPSTPQRLKGIAISRRKRLSYRLQKGGTSFSGETAKEYHFSKSNHFAGGADNFSQAFTQHMPGSGHIGVFFRDKTTQKMKQAYGPSVQYFMHDDDLLKSLNLETEKRFLQEFKNDFQELTGLKI